VSVPLVSIIGTVVGVLSTHFTKLHRPSDVQITALIEAGSVGDRRYHPSTTPVPSNIWPLADSVAEIVQTGGATSASDRRISKAEVILTNQTGCCRKPLPILRSRQLLNRVSLRGGH
jgi:hypothetical protein